LHGQQQVISPWPQNPQAMMGFAYPIEVMQITKIHPVFLHIHCFTDAFLTFLDGWAFLYAVGGHEL
jgi:hypothetical protein